ncbi:MAG: phosphogluconate dehydrogenase C-terminal domain-containing protein [Candidatus Bathyarchaeia archaeon]
MKAELGESRGKLTVTIIGAGGTAGSYITDRLLKGDYNVLLCEKDEGLIRLQKKGFKAVEMEKAVPISDVVIMTVPDDKISDLSRIIVPLMKRNATMILLDAAAAYIGDVYLRDDCSFVIAHPCHPQLFQEQESAEAYRDFFGGVAKQDIVIALLHGREENFKIAERICREIFAPVVNCYRLTVDEMAILEPIASEVIIGAASYLMREAFNEVVKHGVSEEAARAFLLGHIRILLAVLFEESSHKISKAAENAIRYGCDRILKPDWRKVFDTKEMEEIIRKILKPTE